MSFKDCKHCQGTGHTLKSSTCLSCHKVTQRYGYEYYKCVDCVLKARKAMRYTIVENNGGLICL